MRKLTRQSPLFDIVNRINDLIEEFDNNKDIYENFKPNIKDSISAEYQAKDLPLEYEVKVMGLYEIRFSTKKASLDVEVYRNQESIKQSLDPKKPILPNIFLSKGDKLILRSEDIGAGDTVSVNMVGNLLDTFMTQYERVGNNLDVVEGMANQINIHIQEVETMIKEFYGTINLEPISQEELDELLTSLDSQERNEETGA